MSEIISLMVELDELTRGDDNPTYIASLERAEKETEADIQELMLGSIKSVIEAEMIKDGISPTRANCESKSNDKYVQQLVRIRNAKLLASAAAAKHNNYLNRIKAIQALLIAEQSLAKNLNR